MSAIDYYGIKRAMRDIFAEDAATNNLVVRIEDELLLDALGVTLNIELASRDAVRNPLTMGQRMAYRAHYVITVIARTLEREVAEKQRDETIANVEWVLMKNRTLRDNVDALWLEGGEALFLKDERSGMYTAAADLKVITEVQITTI